ncbi:MAG: CoA pyrophosphatase [Desulfarculales bacterium]|nr:CoA pyrophosphatase [Desulfarculales bacterium]
MFEKYPLPLAAVIRGLQTALSSRTVRLAETVFAARPASVFFPLCWHENLVQVLFTKRAGHLSHHAGQISFPGGSRERDDPDPAFTALRETGEEIGVPCSNLEIIARLDQMTTLTGFCVTPFLGVIAPGSRLKPNREEVERIIMVPLSKVLNQEYYREEEISWRGNSGCWMAVRHNDDIIWGATARILLAFIAALREGGLDYKIALDIPA